MLIIVFSLRFGRSLSSKPFINTKHIVFRAIYFLLVMPFFRFNSIECNHMTNTLSYFNQQQNSREKKIPKRLCKNVFIYSFISWSNRFNRMVHDERERECEGARERDRSRACAHTLTTHKYTHSARLSSLVCFFCFVCFFFFVFLHKKQKFLELAFSNI